MIEINHLTKKYGNHVAVDDLSLTIEPGKIYGFLGPNGAATVISRYDCVGVSEICGRTQENSKKQEKRYDRGGHGTYQGKGYAEPTDQEPV